VADFSIYLVKREAEFKEKAKVAEPIWAKLKCGDYSLNVWTICPPSFDLEQTPTEEKLSYIADLVPLKVHMLQRLEQYLTIYAQRFDHVLTEAYLKAQVSAYQQFLALAKKNSSKQSYYLRPPPPIELIWQGL